MQIFIKKPKLTNYTDSINRLYNSVVWTHKIHRTYLETLEARRKTFEIIKIIIVSSSVVSTSLCAYYNNKIGTIVSSVLLFISTVISEILDKIETKENVKKFKNSSEKLYELKQSLILLADEIKSSSISEESVKNQIILLEYIFNSCTNDLPEIPNRIIKKTSNKIKERKDEELDFKLL